MKFSVITVSYNAGNVIEKTILSIINQTYKEMEYVVVDGGSIDGTKDVIKKYDTKISKWISEPDNGIYEAMNKGVKMSSGEYCIFMNAGDSFVNQYVLQKVSNLINENADVIVGNEISVRNGRICNFIRPPKKVSAEFLVQSSLRHQASLIKRDLLIENPYDENLRLASDWKFSIEMLVLKPHFYQRINVNMCFFDTGGRTFTNLDDGRKERKEVIQHLLPEYSNYKSNITFVHRITKFIIKWLMVLLLSIKFMFLKFF